MQGRYLVIRKSDGKALAFGSDRAACEKAAGVFNSLNVDCHVRSHVKARTYRYADADTHRKLKTIAAEGALAFERRERQSIREQFGVE